MITNITLENFKCFRQVSINPKLLTVLIGPNGTGKSSILQALLLLKQSGGSNFPKHTGEFINLRTSGDLFPNFLEDGLVKLNVEGHLRQKEVIYSRSFDRNLVSLPAVEGPGSSVELIEMLDWLKFVPAIRGLVRPTYELGNDYEELTLQNGLDSYAEQLATNLIYRHEESEKLSKMLQSVTGVGLGAYPIPGRKVEVKSHIPVGDVNVTGEGFGTNSLIQLFHQLIAAVKGATVLIEEPEIHLHPKAQADLAEVLAETAKAEDKQIIMTTHSEHLVERLLLLVAEGTLTADDLAIYSFSKDEKGECFAAEIEVLENGQVEGGLTDFYANNLETLDRRVKALKRSK